MYMRFHVKYPLFSSNFNQNWIISTDVREILRHSPAYWAFHMLATGQLHNKPTINRV
jgi:hypothetical protein